MKNNTIIFRRKCIGLKKKVQQLLKPRKYLQSVYYMCLALYYVPHRKYIDRNRIGRNKDILLLHTGRPLKIYHFTGLEKDT